MKSILLLSKTLLVAFIAVIGFLTALLPALAQEESTGLGNPTFQQGTIVDVIEEEEFEVEGSPQTQIYQKLKIEIDTGEQRGETITTEIGNEITSNINRYTEGDKIVLAISEDQDGNSYYYVTDHYRIGPLLTLTVAFIAAVLIVGRKKGLFSLISLGVTFIAVFAFIIPNIIDGKNPLLISVTASLFIIPVTFYLSHGLKRETTVAVIGTAISLLFTGILASLFVHAASVTGMGFEDSYFLQTIGSRGINLTNLIIAGIFIASLGVLDDVTISQVSIVKQLHHANPNQSMPKLYAQAMTIGKDHIASMVNTLVLAYTGASIPTLLIFSASNYPTNYLVNLEIVAVEIIRTLVSSIGLIVAIPMTTLLAAYSVSRRGTPETKLI